MNHQKESSLYVYTLSCPNKKITKDGQCTGAVFYVRIIGAVLFSLYIFHVATVFLSCVSFCFFALSGDDTRRGVRRVRKGGSGSRRPLFREAQHHVGQSRNSPD